MPANSRWDLIRGLKGYRPSPYRAVNAFYLGYKSQSVNVVGAEVAVCSQINTKHVNTV